MVGYVGETTIIPRPSQSFATLLSRPCPDNGEGCDSSAVKKDSGGTDRCCGKISAKAVCKVEQYEDVLVRLSTSISNGSHPSLSLGKKQQVSSLVPWSQRVVRSKKWWTTRSAGSCISAALVRPGWMTRGCDNSGGMKRPKMANLIFILMVAQGREIAQQ